MSACVCVCNSTSPDMDNACLYDGSKAKNSICELDRPADEQQGCSSENRWVLMQWKQSYLTSSLSVADGHRFMRSFTVVSMTFVMQGNYWEERFDAVFDEVSR